MKEETKTFCIRNIPFYGAATWTLRNIDRKYVESFEKWSKRKMEKISWADHVKNEEVLQRVKAERSILQTIKRKANWIGNIWRRNCFLNHFIQGKMEGRKELMGRSGRRCKQLLEIEKGSNISHSVENSVWKRI